MYLHSEDLRKIENRARQLRAEQLRKFIVNLFSRPERNTTPNLGKTA